MPKPKLFAAIFLLIAILLPACAPAANLEETDLLESAAGQCAPADIQARAVGPIALFQQPVADDNLAASLAALEELQLALQDLAADCSSAQLAEDEARIADILEKLSSGGYVIYVRHTHTDRSRGDTDLSHCDTQRILSDLGREQALEIRDAYQQLAFPIDRLITTEYCRTRETTILAFGVPEIIPRAQLAEQLPALLAAKPATGENTIIVAHIGTLEGTVGLPDKFEEGDSLIYQPGPDGTFDYVGRIALADWPLLAQTWRQINSSQ